MNRLPNEPISPPNQNKMKPLDPIRRTKPPSLHSPLGRPEGNRGPSRTVFKEVNRFTERTQFPFQPNQNETT